MTENHDPKPARGIPKIAFVIVGLCVLCFGAVVCAIGGFFLFSGHDSGEKKPAATQQENVLQPTTAADNQTWLILLYFDADDPILEEDILFDFNEAEMAGSTKRVKIIAQIDRYKKGYKGDGNWTGARRYEITRDNNLEKINSKLVKDLGEIDMSDPQELINFATWGIEAYPADRHVLIMSDHGMGWPGGWTDTDNNGEDFVFISTARLENALKSITAETGIEKFDLVGMDACLMGMLEVYSAIAPYSRYAVASEEVEPGLGWAYAEFLKGLTTRPEMSNADFAKSIVSAYIEKDQHILNKDARAKLITRFGLDPEISTQDLITGFKSVSTLSAVDLTAIADVQKNLNGFASTLKDADQKKVADSRTYSRSFTNTFDDKLPSPYLDLGHFAGMIAQRSGDETAAKAASSLRASIKKAVIAETHGTERKGSTGISIFFPVSDLYWNENVGVKLYTNLCNRFVKATLWDDYLAFHYAGQEFDKGIPDSSKKIPAPGLGADIEITPLTLSASTITAGDSIHLKTEITGSQVAYIYLLMLLEKDKDNYLLYRLDYFRGVDTREEDGIFYPVWKMDGAKIPIDIDWTPRSFGVCNGSICSYAHLEPESFGKTDQDTLYSSAGKYIFTEDGISRDARMYFRNDEKGEMTRITGFTGGSSTGIAAAAINPAPGDEWQFLDTWLTRSADGGFDFVYHEGNRIAFEDELFHFGIRDSDAGKYRIAVMVKDMDGNDTFQFAPLTIKEK